MEKKAKQKEVILTHGNNIQPYHCSSSIFILF